MTSLEKIGLVSSVVAAAASVLVVIVGAACLFGSMSGQVDDNTGDLASMKDDMSRLTADVHELREGVAVLKTDMGWVKQSMKVIHSGLYNTEDASTALPPDPAETIVLTGNGSAGEHKR